MSLYIRAVSRSSERLEPERSPKNVRPDFNPKRRFEGFDQPPDGCPFWVWKRISSMFCDESGGAESGVFPIWQAG